MSEPEMLLRSLRRIQLERAPSPRWNSPELYVNIGLDTETDPGEYYWDGLKRGVDPEHPYLIFQYTLEGRGAYLASKVVHHLTPGKAFLAVIPGAHAYYLPPDSPSWTFFYLVIRHPYLAGRIRETQKRAGAVYAIAPDEMLLATAVKVFEGVWSQSFRDEWALEQALFDFLTEYERFAQRLLYPQDLREKLLDEVRRYVLAQMGRHIVVDELAERSGMSRSHYSHKFKAATGLSPAQWVAQVCLEEATRRLRDSDTKLEVVARETGFANANHLCKVFRRNFHLSPGEFRRQMR